MVIKIKILVCFVYLFNYSYAQITFPKVTSVNIDKFKISENGFFHIKDDVYIENKNLFERYIFIDSGDIILDGYFYKNKSDSLFFLPYNKKLNSCAQSGLFAILRDSTFRHSSYTKDNCFTQIFSDKTILLTYKLEKTNTNEHFIIVHEIYNDEIIEYTEEDDTSDYEMKYVVKRVFYFDLQKGIIKIELDKEHEKKSNEYFQY